MPRYNTRRTRKRTRRRRGRNKQRKNLVDEFTFRYLQNIPVNKMSSDFLYSISQINFSPLGAYTKSWFTNKALGYDMYRVKHINVTATPGSNFGIDQRGQCNIFTRYDPAYNELPNAVASSTELMFASNTKQFNFGRNSKLNILSGAPKVKRTSGSTSSNPLLPSNLQWYNTSDLLNTNLQNRWNLGTVFVTLPLPPGGYDSEHLTTISLIVTAKVEFKLLKGPISADETMISFMNDYTPAETVTDNQITYDLTQTDTELRTGLLTGLLFPIDVLSINVGNIGFTATGAVLHGIKFRRQLDMKYFEVIATEDSNVYANEYTHT